ncbi:MAG: SMP-30/gluconolactonase/LRE family protein [Bacteroidales bacterium]
MKTFIKSITGIIALMLITTFMASGQQMVKDNAEPEKITEGYQFTEGPVWHDSGYLLFSDIPANTIFKWTPGSEAEVYMKPSGHSNGLTFDRQDRLVMAQHDGAVAKQVSENSFEVVVDSYNGKRLNSPNDLVVKSDSSIYFTDPSFGVSEEDKELDIQGVYRYSKDQGLQLLVSDFDMPNGIAFSPDEEKLYVNDSRHNHIRVFKVKSNGTLKNGKVFAKMESEGEGGADGMKVDVKGNVYSTGPGGLWIFSPEGELIRQVKTPRITNLAWGEKKRKTLFMTSPNAVYKLEMKTKGYTSF